MVFRAKSLFTMVKVLYIQRLIGRARTYIATDLRTMQACSFNNVASWYVRPHDWTDCPGRQKVSTLSSATPGHTPKLERDLQQEVEGGCEQLALAPATETVTPQG